MSEERIPKYQIGDIVKLNAGGPDMTILRRKKHTPLGSHHILQGFMNASGLLVKSLIQGSFKNQA